MNVQIFSVVHDVLRVDLVVKIAGAEKHVNRELINMGYANEAEESYLSNVRTLRCVVLTLIHQLRSSCSMSVWRVCY